MNPRLNYYISISEKLVNSFSGDLPFYRILKNHFSQNKKHGSKDRKIISEICFSYFRIGNAAIELDFIEKIKIAVFLCNNASSVFLELFDKEFANNLFSDSEKKLDFIKRKYPFFKLDDVFPLPEKICIEQKEEFIASHFFQPDLFIRIRNNNHNKVIEKLIKNEIVFKEINTNTLSLTNSTKLESVLSINLEAVIQDLSSQRISDFLEIVKNNFKSTINVWDCCSGSGGKSILAVDVLKNIQLTVSDIRPSIIENLKNRFIEAGIINYKSLVADLSVETSFDKKFDLIICDAPCSGSGTWGRTPEMLSCFDDEKLKKYVQLQKTITVNAIKNLNKNGYFLYITCSVFADENEKIVDFLINEHNLEIVKSSYILGLKNKADSMYAALLKYQK